MFVYFVKCNVPFTALTLDHLYNNMISVYENVLWRSEVSDTLRSYFYTGMVYD